MIELSFNDNALHSYLTRYCVSASLPLQAIIPRIVPIELVGLFHANSLRSSSRSRNRRIDFHVHMVEFTERSFTEVSGLNN